MLDEDTRQRLLEQFADSLAQATETPDPGAGEPGSAAPPDLHTLLAEMAALKNEARLQARQARSAVEELHAFGEALREHNERLQRDLEQARAAAATARAEAERGLLLGLIDLRDSLQAALAAAQPPRGWAAWFGGAARLAASLREGSALTVQRVDALLAGHRVRPIAAVGQPLDPHSMRAVAVESSAGQPAGVVLRELRPGYRQGSELLREAEVIVNKPLEAESA